MLSWLMRHPHPAESPGAPRRPRCRPAPPPDRRRTPDVLGARTHRIARIAVPVVLALVYGYWVAADNRAGGPITGWNLLLGFASALVFAVVCIALLALAPRMIREVHALLWTAFVGIAFGFLYSQSGHSILRSIVMSALIAGATFVVFFYRYYTREDAFGRRIR